MSSMCKPMKTGSRISNLVLLQRPHLFPFSLPPIFLPFPELRMLQQISAETSEHTHIFLNPEANKINHLRKPSSITPPFFISSPPFSSNTFSGDEDTKY